MDEGFNEASVLNLLQNINKSKKYVFLIGAGTSRHPPAEIPTGGELVNAWRKECYEAVNTEEEFEQWVNSAEKNMTSDQNTYGFWFERRHPMRWDRRKRVQELVEHAEPTVGHVLLAVLMEQQYIPYVITPNFDDLLLDSFYLFLESRPYLINHDAIAPKFQLTRDRPAIVKLHGDYLYDNLQNTSQETKNLKPSMERLLHQTVSEYGLVVIGYSGNDDSIMNPIIESELSEYGVYWCQRSLDDLSPKVEKMLEKDNTRLIEIDGFTDLMLKFEAHFDDAEIPKPQNLVERGEDRAYMLMKSLNSGEETASLEFRLENMSQHIKRGAIAFGEGDHEKAISERNKYLANWPDHGWMYHLRGVSKLRLGNKQEAMEDFTKAIDLQDELDARLSRSKLSIVVGQYEQAKEDANRAESFSRTRHVSAECIFLDLTASLLLGEDIAQREREFRKLCEEDFQSSYVFPEIKSWLQSDQISTDHRAKVLDWLQLLESHQG